MSRRHRSVHALDVSKLKVPEITFWTVREGSMLLGCGRSRSSILGMERSSRCGLRWPSDGEEQGVRCWPT